MRKPSAWLLIGVLVAACWYIWTCRTHAGASILVPLAAVAEMVDRTHEGHWETDLDEVLVGYGLALGDVRTWLWADHGPSPRDLVHSACFSRLSFGLETAGPWSG